MRQMPAAVVYCGPTARREAVAAFAQELGLSFLQAESFPDLHQLLWKNANAALFLYVEDAEDATIDLAKKLRSSPEGSDIFLIACLENPSWPAVVRVLEAMPDNIWIPPYEPQCLMPTFEAEWESSGQI